MGKVLGSMGILGGVGDWEERERTYYHDVALLLRLGRHCVKIFFLRVVGWFGMVWDCLIEMFE